MPSDSAGGTANQAATGAVAQAIQAVELAVKAATAYQRPDLATRARQALQRLHNPRVRVLVVGEFKQGKSMLVNALLNAPICPIDDDISTSVPTVVRFGDNPSVTLVRAARISGEDDEREERTQVPVEKLADYVSEAGNPGNHAGLKYAEVGVPRNILADGLELVDTPGVGGLASVHGSATMAMLPSADAILLVSDAAAEYSRPELEFLRQAGRICPNVACVVTKIDLYPQWQRITELDKGHLASVEIDAELLPTSSVLRLHAVQAEDRQLNLESGFPALVSFLRDRVVGQSERLANRSAANDVVTIAGQLASGMRAELAATEDPGEASRLMAELERAKTRAADLRNTSSRWHQVLNDGIADLNADVDYDLRDRMRSIVREGEKIVDGVDPGKVWDQFALQVEDQAAAAAAANFLWASERARWLAGQVAELFAEDGARSLPDLPDSTGPDLPDLIGEMEDPAGEKFGAGQRAFVGLRGGYMGTLMAGMYSTFMGLTLLNPFSAAAGLLMGGKMMRDESKRLLERRRMEAKNTVRRYVDDVSFQVGKQSRDMLRHVQRELRDHFMARSDELVRSAQESLIAAERASQTGEAGRQQRIADLRAELQRIGALEKQGQALVPAGD
ncbi:MAG TPA: dynamin family protein [Streptosporangiaceae bacterium]|nr:dynamin family protein [Streptosporangiaceae bacterium]